MERAYSHQGHGPRADQKGRIQIREVRLPARSHLRSAAGPYKSLHSGRSERRRFIRQPDIAEPVVVRPTWAADSVRSRRPAGRIFIRQTAESVTLSGTRDGLIERSDCSTDFDSFGLISGVAFRMTSPRLTVVPMRRFILMVAVLVAGCPAYAQDPVSTDGTKYKVIFENARVRVLEYRDLPGDKTNQHAHRAFVLYEMATFKRNIMLPNGKTIMREFNAGDILCSEMQTHVGENVGTTPTHVIMMELK